MCRAVATGSTERMTLGRAGFDFRKGRRLAFGNCPGMALTAGRGRRCAGNARGNGKTHLHHVFEKTGATRQAISSS
jgi:hypothetical protein